MADQRARGGRCRPVADADRGQDRRVRFQVAVAYVLPWKDAFVADLESAGVRTHCLGDDGESGSGGWAGSDGSCGRGTTGSSTPQSCSCCRRTDVRPTVDPHPHRAQRLGRYRRLTYFATALTYGRNDVVIAVSDGVAESIRHPRWLPGSYPEVETLLHGVEPDGAPRGATARRAARRELALDDAVPVIGNVANLTPKKDHARLIAAFERVRAELPDAVLVLVGIGPLEEELRRLVLDCGLDEAVRFLGVRTDVPKLLPALDVFVLGSLFEGLPISLLETMAAEVACATTAVGGIPEAVTDGVEGRLVSPGERGPLAKALVEVLANPQQRATLAVDLVPDTVSGG